MPKQIEVNPTGQKQQAKARITMLLRGLGQLSPEDAAYALIGRAFAKNAGASQAVIEDIVDRATAAQYVTQQTDYAGFNQSAINDLTIPADAKAVLNSMRAFQVASLDAQATALQVIVAVLGE